MLLFIVDNGMKGEMRRLPRAIWRPIEAWRHMIDEVIHLWGYRSGTVVLRLFIQANPPHSSCCLNLVFFQFPRNNRKHGCPDAVVRRKAESRKRPDLLIPPLLRNSMKRWPTYITKMQPIREYFMHKLSSCVVAVRLNVGEDSIVARCPQECSNVFSSLVGTLGDHDNCFGEAGSKECLVTRLR